VQLALMIGLLVAALVAGARESLAVHADAITVVHRVLPRDAIFDPHERQGFVPMGSSISLGYTTDDLWIGFERNDAASLPGTAPLIVQFTPAYTRRIDIHLLDRTSDTLELVASCGASSHDRTACSATGLPGTWEVPGGRIADVLIRFAGSNSLSVRIDFISPSKVSWDIIPTMMAIGAMIALSLLSVLLIFASFSWLPAFFATFAILQALHSALLVGVPHMLFPERSLATLFDINLLALVGVGWALHYRAIYEIAKPGLPLRVSIIISSIFSIGALLFYVFKSAEIALQLNMVHIGIMPIIFLTLVVFFDTRKYLNTRSEMTIRRLLLFYLSLFAFTMIIPVAASFGFGVSTPGGFAWNAVFVLIFFGIVVYRHMIEQALAHERSTFALRLSAERARTNERLARIYTEATIGGMTTHLSHEMRTPLATILTSLNNLRAILPDDHAAHREAGRNLDRMERAVSRMRSVMQGVNAFIRAPRITGRSSLTQAVKQSLSLVESRLRTECITLSQDIPKAEVFVQADKFDVETAVLNIIVNAFDAAAERPMEPRCVNLEISCEAGSACVVVTDNGGGIAEGNLERLFEPLFTTKPDGTGLGLPLARQMAERWGGAIRITNHAEGAQAILSFPLAHDPDADHV